MSTPAPDFLTKEPFEVYRRKSKKYLSSHQLADFRKCPALWQKKNTGEIPDADRPAYAIGRAAHKLIIEGREAFDAEYAVGGPINPKTKREYGVDTLAYAEWLQNIRAATTKTDAVSTECAAQLEQMRAAVRSHAVAAPLLSNGHAEHVCRAIINEVECQTRMDWYSPIPNVIVDLKTCEDLTWMEQDIQRYGYDYQMAFYCAVLQRHLPLTSKPAKAFIIGVEKSAAMRVGVWQIGFDRLQECAAENAAAIVRFKECKRNNLFPTYFEETRIYAGGA